MTKQFLLSTMLAAGSIFSHAQSWQPVGANGVVSDGNANFVKIARSASGVLHVSYQDQSVNNQVTVRKFDGSNWVDVGTKGFSPGGATYIDMEIHGETPYVAFTDYNNNRRLQVMKFDGSSWVNVGPYGLSVNEVEYIDLEINAAGEPVVAFKNALGGELSVLHYTGGNWQPIGSFSGTQGCYHTQLEIHPLGVPFLFFEDMNDQGQARLVRFNSSTGVWENGMNGTGAVSTSELGLLITPDERIYLSHRENNATRDLSVFERKDGMGFYYPDKLSGLPVEAFGHMNEMAADTNGVLFITYMETFNPGSQLKVRKFITNTGSWQDVDSTGSTPADGHSVSYPAMLINGNNEPVVAFKDQNLQKAVCRYFRNAGVPEDTSGGGNNTSIEYAGSTGNVQVYPNPATERIQVSAGSEISRLALFNMQGQAVLQAEGLEGKNASMDIRNLQPGIYILKVESGKGVGVHRIIKR